METQRKCIKCNGELIVKIYKNRIGCRQQGIYCKDCGKYYKFLDNSELLFLVENGFKVKNLYGNLDNTKIGRIKYLIH